MPRRPKFEITETPKGFQVNVPASLSKTGRRERYYHADEKAAKKHAAGLLKRYHEYGTKAGSIAPSLAQEAEQARTLLEPYGASLLDAVREYVERRKSSKAALSFGDAWGAYTDNLVSLGRSDATLQDYARDRRAIPGSIFKRTVAEITEDQLEKALDTSIKTKPLRRGKTWNRRLRECRAVLNWARIDEVKQAKLANKNPEIVSAEIAEKLMRAAEEQGCALAFALLCFAGVRPLGELSRISWGNIKKDYVEIGSDEGKTDVERHVPISANLRKWITKHQGEPILPVGWEKKRRAVRKAAGISDQQDVLRHTFLSCFYRLHGEHEMVQAAGHTTFKTFERFYNRARTTAQAQAYFQICPKGMTVPKPKALRAA